MAGVDEHLIQLEEYCSELVRMDLRLDEKILTEPSVIRGHQHKLEQKEVKELLAQEEKKFVTEAIRCVHKLLHTSDYKGALTLTRKIQGWIPSLKTWDEAEHLNTACDKILEELKLKRSKQNKRFSLLMRLDKKIRENREQEQVEEIWTYLQSDIKSLDEDIEAIAEVIESYITQDIAIEQLVEAYQDFNPQPFMSADLLLTPTPTTPIAKLAQNIIEGNAVLFIGSELAYQHQINPVTEQTFARKMAEELGLKNFQGSLSKVIAYGYAGGKKGFVKQKLAEYLQYNRELSFYQLLAKSDEPQIVISMSYDDQLEQCFSRHNKKFAVLELDYFDPERLMYLKCSDEPYSRKVTGTDLSKEMLVGKHYSLIYKIRGTYHNNIQEDRLVLEEANFFDLAASKNQIPDYLRRLIQGSECWFLGFRPRNWDDRLLVDILLSAMRDSRMREKIHVRIEKNIDQFEKTYWKLPNVVCHQFELTGLDEKLAQLMPFELEEVT